MVHKIYVTDIKIIHAIVKNPRIENDEKVEAVNEIIRISRHKSLNKSEILLNHMFNWRWDSLLDRRFWVKINVLMDWYYRYYK